MSKIEERIQKTVYFDKDDFAFIEEQAEKEERSISNMLRILIKEYKNGNKFKKQNEKRVD